MNTLKPINVLLAEDHAIVRQGLCALITAADQCTIVGEARNGREAVELAQTLQPDVIVMDIAMPVLNGLEATKQILAANPAARVLILSAHSDDAYLDNLCAAGAIGFLEKQTSADVLIRAIREVALGRAYFSPSITQRLQQKKARLRGRDGQIQVDGAQLTSREYEVLQLVAEGNPNKGVAAELGISIKTVEKHRQHLMDKLNIHDTAGLTRYAIATGIIESSVQVTIE